MRWCCLANLLERIADRIEEILIGLEDRAVECELDHCLRAADGVHLPAQIRKLGRVDGDAVVRLASALNQDPTPIRAAPLQSQFRCGS